MVGAVEGWVQSLWANEKFYMAVIDLKFKIQLIDSITNFDNNASSQLTIQTIQALENKIMQTISDYNCTDSASVIDFFRIHRSSSN